MAGHRVRADQGGSILEYAAVFALVAVLAGTLIAAAPGIGSVITSLVHDAVCAAFGEEGCGAGEARGEPPDGGDASEEREPLPEDSGNDPADSGPSDAEQGAEGGEPEGWPPPVPFAEPIAGPLFDPDGTIEPLDSPSWLDNPDVRSTTSSRRVSCMPANHVERQPRCSGGAPGWSLFGRGNLVVRGEFGVMTTDVDIESVENPDLALHENYATGEEELSTDVTYWQWAEHVRAYVAGGGVEVPLPYSMYAVGDYLETTGEGERTYTQVTVNEEDFAAIEEGRLEAPNPFDPLSMPVYSSIYLEEENFLQDTAGEQLWVGWGDARSSAYGAVSVRDQVGITEGEALSSEVYRVSDDHVMVTVGDTETMRANREMGLGAEAWLGNATGNHFRARGSLVSQNLQMTSEGDLYTSVLDISTGEGWDAYQDFITRGVLPGADNPGVEETFDTWIFNRAERARLYAEGNINVGLEVPGGFGVISIDESLRLGWNSPGSDNVFSETVRDDGSVLSTQRASQGMVTVEVTQEVTSRGHVRDPEFAFMLQDVAPGSVQNLLWLMEGEDAVADYDNDDRVHVVLSFTEQDMMDLHDLTIAYAAEVNGMTEQEVRSHMESERLDGGDRPGLAGLEPDELDWIRHGGQGTPVEMMAQDVGWAEHSVGVAQGLFPVPGSYNPEVFIRDFHDTVEYMHYHGLGMDTDGGALPYLGGEMEIIER